MDVFGMLFGYLGTLFGMDDAAYSAYTKDIENIEEEMVSFLNHMGGYVYYTDYKDILEKARAIQTEASQKFRFNRILKSAAFKTLSREYSTLKTSIVQFQRGIDEHNHAFLKTAVADAYNLIGNVEGRRLDFQQMACIAKEAHSHLVVAGAGTGKTTTIIGKVKALIAGDRCKPEEILILSFTHDAAAEMKRRLSKEVGVPFNVCTFHKLGYDIIRKAEHVTPKVFTGNQRQQLLNFINVRLSDKSYQRLVITYLLYNRVQQRSEFDFESEQDYFIYLEANPPTTIREETVKSYGEMVIANFLAQNGIKYLYESEYEIDTRNEE